MLYPQSNPFRQVIDISGFWELRFDPETQAFVRGVPLLYLPVGMTSLRNGAITSARPGIKHTSTCLGAGMQINSRFTYVLVQ